MKKFVNIVTILVMVIGNILMPFANATWAQFVDLQEPTPVESGDNFGLDGDDENDWNESNVIEWENAGNKWLEEWKEKKDEDDGKKGGEDLQAKWTWNSEQEVEGGNDTWAGSGNDTWAGSGNDTWAGSGNDTWAGSGNDTWAGENWIWDDESEEETLEELVERLWIDRETQAVYYAVLAWIYARDYEWTAEQDEIIRTYLLDHENEILEGSNPKYPRWLTRDFNDIVYTWVVRWKLFTITLMDRNLWAKETWVWADASTDSYGYYYQWWNNFPFHFDTNLNDINSTKVDTLWFWPGKRFYWNKFIRWNDEDGDWSDEWNNNLWWWAWDNQGNNYWEDGINRQWPCPEWYYIPSAKEWHELLEVFLANNDVEAISNNWKTYPDFVGDEWWATYEPDEQIIASFLETFNIPYAWRIRWDWTVDRVWSGIHIWTSTPKDEKSLQIEFRDDRINLWWWKTIRVIAMPVRCFKSVETENVSYTVTYIQDGEQTTESVEYGEHLQEPPHIDKGGWYSWSWWRLSGSDLFFDFTGTEITWDITLIATWGCAPDYHEWSGSCVSNTKNVNCIQTWKVEHSTYIETWVDVTRNIASWDWNPTPACGWECIKNYHQSWDVCYPDEFNFTIERNDHIDTEWSTENGKVAYGSDIVLKARAKNGYAFRWWEFIGLEWSWEVSTDTSNDTWFSMPANDLYVIPMSKPILYTILYNNISGATMEDNPTSYNIETSSFTLNNPSKVGYTFGGRTGSNGDTPQLTVTIEQWSMWNKVYNATWIPNTWTKYRVLHIRERSNSNGYSLHEDEVLSGTTDEYTEAKAREYTGFVQTGTIRQKIINGDGSTYIRIFYDRIRYSITFDSNWGSAVETITWKYEQNLTAPADPTRAGYVFSGWEPTFPSTMPLWWANLVAQWTKKSSWWGGGWSSSTPDKTPENTWTLVTWENVVSTWLDAISEVANMDINVGTTAPVATRMMSLGKSMLGAIEETKWGEEVWKDLEWLDEIEKWEEKGEIKGYTGNYAILMPWTGFNITIKSLAINGRVTNYTTSDTEIITIRRGSARECANIWVPVLISDKYSPIEIRAAISRGSIIYCTDADVIYFNSDSSYMFYNLQNLVSTDLTWANTSNVTNMKWMWGHWDSLTNLDVSNWDTSNVTDMSNMFAECRYLTNLDVSNWDTSNVTDMSNMFWYCRNLTNLDVNNWNTSSVTSMSNMFSNCDGLTNLDVSNWDTSNVTDMNHMFWSCMGLTNLDLSNWDTSNVTDMYHMFWSCRGLTNLDVSNWDTSNVTDMSQMFSDCRSLTNLDVSNWNTSNVDQMAWMFNSCYNLEKIYASDSFSTASVGDGGHHMFGYDTNLVWWNGTTYDANHDGVEYARIDRVGTSGYFTKKYRDLDVYFISSTWVVKNSNLLDRNLWATVTWTWDNAATWSYGYLYQWWNNHWFEIWCRTSNCSDSVTTNATTTKAIWNDSYNMKWYNWENFIKVENMQDDYWEWGYYYNNLWWWSGDSYTYNIMANNPITWRQWPCPVGYHVPSIVEWRNLLRGYVSSTSGFELHTLLNIVDAPSRSSTDATLRYSNGMIYLTSSPSHGSTVESVSVITGSLQFGVSSYRASGYPVRCFANDYLTSPAMNVYPNWWTGAMIMIDEWVIVKLWSPSRVHSVFGWWYSDWSFATQIVTWSVAPVNLYAKWTCETGYMLSGNTCVEATPPSVTLTSTSNLKVTTQTATLKCSDWEWVTAYYWWTTEPTSANSITTTTDLSELISVNWLSKTVDRSWIYWLACKNAEGRWDKESIAMYGYTVYNMEEDVDGTTTAYNTRNYRQRSTHTYLAPSGTTINYENIWSNPDLCDIFVWWSVGQPTTSTTTVNTTNQILTADNSKYWVWYKRKTFGLTLNKWTWISSVSGAWTYKWWKSVTINATVKDGYTWNKWTRTAWMELGFTPTTRTQTVSIQCSSNLTGTTLRADATPNTYTITYNTSSGNLYDGWGHHPETNIIEYTPEDDLTLYTNFKEWYTFNGWDVDEDESDGSWLSISDTITNMHIGSWHYWDVLLTYNSTPQMYTLYIDDSDSDVSPNELDVVYGEYLNAEGTTLEDEDSLPIARKTGYNFRWYAKQPWWSIILSYSNGRVSPTYEFNDGNFVVNHQNRTSTIYPIFQAKSVTIVYFDDVNGNSSLTGNHYWDTVTLLNPSAPNHVFLWWYTAKTGWTLFWTWWVQYTINIDESPIYLYARWSCASGYVAIAEACMPAFEDIDAYFISSTWSVSNITLMDRNLWAKTDNISSTWSYGYHYQWWNNHGFEPCYQNGCDDFPWGEETTEAWYDVSLCAWTPSTCFYRKFVLKNNRNNNDSAVNLWWWWSDALNNGRWANATNVEDRQWPCPEGYHVPSAWEWAKLLGYRATLYYTWASESMIYDVWLSLTDANPMFKSRIQQGLNLPFAGIRNYDDAVVSNLGEWALFWSSSKLSSTPIMFVIDNTLSMMWNYIGYPGDARSLRCFRNQYYWGMDIYANGWTWAIIIVEWELIKKLWIPQRAHSIFGWWYPEPEFENLLVTWAYAPDEIYAKWTCETGYVSSGNACVDNIKPVCTWWTPANICVSWWMAWTIQLTCTDGVWISQTSVSASNVTYNTSWLTLWNSDTVAWTSTGKTYTFIYTWKSGVNGTTWFTLKANAVKDTSNNGNLVTWPSTGVQVDNAGPAAPEMSADAGDVATSLTDCLLVGAVGDSTHQCPQFDFDRDGVVEMNDHTVFMEDYLDKKYVYLNGAITNTSKPMLVWMFYSGSDVWCSNPWEYEIQICSNNNCSTVIKSGSYAEVSWPNATTNLSDGKYYWRVRARDELWNWWNRSNIWNFTVDTTKPVCSRWTPTNICVSWWVAWTITLTCTDGGWISQTKVNASNVTYNTSWLTLWNSNTVAWTSTGKTYSFTYTWKSGVNGMTWFTLKANAVKDVANNGNVATWPSTGIQIDNAWPTAPVLWSLSNIIEQLHYYVLESFDIEEEPVDQYDFNGDGVVDSIDLNHIVQVNLWRVDNSIVYNNGAITNSSKPKLTWLIPEDVWCSSPEGYQIQICSNNNCSTVIKSGSYAEVLWPNATTNLSDGTYYWRVRAEDELWNWWSWSNIWSFTVDTTAPTVTLTTNAVACRTATTYTVTWTFSEAVQWVDQNDLSVTNGTIQSFNVVSSTVAVWTVKSSTTWNGTVSGQIAAGKFSDLAWNNNTAASNSVTWTYDNAGPSAPTLSTPSDNGWVNTLRPTLTWTASSDVWCNNSIWWYEIWVCTAAACTSATKSGTATTTTWTLPSNLTNWTTYYWKVRAKDGLWNRWEWSSVRSFTVDTTAPSKPTCTPNKACFSGNTTSVSCSTTSSDWTVRYTTDGSTPNCSSSVWSNQSFSATTTLKVIACDEAGNASSVNTYTYSKDTTWPDAPILSGCSYDDIFGCVMDGGINRCPQYDFNGDGFVDINDVTSNTRKVCLQDIYVKNDGDITNSSKPKFVWLLVEDHWCSFPWGQEIQICSDSNCNNVINSGSYAELSGSVNLSDGTYYWRVRESDQLWNWWDWSNIWSFTVDTAGPTSTLNTTNTEKSATQRLTWTCEDAAWVTAYYLWTKVSPETGDYNTITSTSSYTTWMNVTAAWTYYLYCKDVVGNISTWKSVTYNTYSVQNMLDKIDWSTWTYNTTNYDTNGSVMWTYVIPNGTTITLNSSSMYGDPIASHDTYKWWKTSNTASGNPTTSNPSISANTTYYRWFWRDTHTLKLTKWYSFASWTVNGWNTPASTANASTTVTITQNTTLTANANDTKKPVGTMTWTNTLKSMTQSFTWTCTDEVWVTAYYLWTNHDPVDSDYIQITPTTSFSIWRTNTAATIYYLYCKDAAGNVSDMAYKQYRQYVVHNMLNKINAPETPYNTTNYEQVGQNWWYVAEIWTRIPLTSVYTIPSGASSDTYKWYSTSDSATSLQTSSYKLSTSSVYHFYTWFTREKYTLTLNAWTGVASVSGWWNGIKYWSWVSISATCKTASGYAFSGWIKNSGNTPASLTANPTTVTITQDTNLTAVCKDNTKPVWTITTTSGTNVTSQTATLNCKDGVGVTKYYWWTSSSPAESAYIAILLIL